MRVKITRGWTEEEVTHLITLADSGASAVRAAAALNRKTNAVQKKARELGKQLGGVRQIRAALRARDEVN